MQDETPDSVVPVDKRSGKLEIRTQRLAAARMVAKSRFRFDDSTRRQLSDMLRQAKVTLGTKVGITT